MAFGEPNVYEQSVDKRYKVFRYIVVNKLKILTVRQKLFNCVYSVFRIVIVIHITMYYFGLAFRIYYMK